MQAFYSVVYRLRGPLMVPPALFMILSFYGEVEHRLVIWPLGMGFFGLGLGLRIWAQMHLHYRLRVHKVLTTTGPYAYIRNPIYLANTLLLVGLTVLSELLWFVPVMVLWAAGVYTLVIRHEEKHLLEKYGDAYAAYLRTRPRWIPRGIRAIASVGAAPQKASFLAPSIVAELHCLLWLIPVVMKEVFSAFC